ncbi:MAG: DNA repair protein RadC [Porticoccaceae bacterium]|jgi:DNA repair protein RadC|nr:DNA repair protein RadC [Porticoccaceae bacterium]MEA3298865.1 DNA repair protein RadC [Pseudomonadota bacterium]HLS97502.1 DNA repair protein RadC [Porticoccaceae bacterium]
MGIKDWPEGERPREKLLARGAAALSDAELLAIFLRTGIRGLSAVDLARALIRDFGGLGPLLAADLSTFCATRGLGEAKYAQLQAVVELSRRHLGEQLVRDHVFTQPATVIRYAQSVLAGRRQEVFLVLFLDSQHRLIVSEEMFFGTIDGASVHPREVVRRALHHNASALILAHNHPSGVAEPSRDDGAITRRLKDALALVDVRVLDHIVVGAGCAVSMAERGLM